MTPGTLAGLVGGVGGFEQAAGQPAGVVGGQLQIDGLLPRRVQVEPHPPVFVHGNLDQP